jgi:large subunit ribosomal protein L38e
LIKGLVVKKRSDKTKFKLRTSKYMYTLVMDSADQEKVAKLEGSLPAALAKKDI